jgi:hypothetical protein
MLPNCSGLRSAGSVAALPLATSCFGQTEPLQSMSPAAMASLLQ